MTREAQPVVRYRTGDKTSLQRGTCTCGRTHPRIARIEGRTDDLLIVRGVNVFPREKVTRVHHRDDDHDPLGLERPDHT